MRPLRTLAATALALAALSGCSDESTSPTETSSTPTESRSPTASPTPETPEEPALPDAATKATKAGARAFITYYWDVVNYAQATGDVSTLKKLSAPTCDTCKGFVANVQEHYAAGGVIVGGENRARITQVAKVSTSTGSAFGFRVEQVVTHEPQVIVDSQGAEDRRSKGSDDFTAYLLWTDRNRWRLDVMELR
ncbi:DUF6318 family protein [Nocardioides sp. J54]|uniref:DUF6318 family protein n=1 Tax=Nocardioides sp. J54 TaxID=935866 RepID=UPI0004B38918|nr:DUF6318 family protein [Nocardioides sp. J54]